MLCLMEKRIHIGIVSTPVPSLQPTEKQRHGLLWIVADGTGREENLRVPIVFDKPELIARQGLNYATWKRVKKQLDKMGIKATHLELDFTQTDFSDKPQVNNPGRFCYKLDEYGDLYKPRAPKSKQQFAVA